MGITAHATIEERGQLVRAQLVQIAEVTRRRVDRLGVSSYSSVRQTPYSERSMGTGRSE